jgi:ADP-ribosyl-[dinitrogen reductase] hydrolase
MPNKFDLDRSLRAKYPRDMAFAPFSTKFGPEDTPLKAPWLEAYFSGKADLEFLGRFKKNDVRALLYSLGADHSDIIDRYRGALLGVAIGDALGMPLEGSARDAHVVNDYEAGGPFQLEAGRWTDETSMTCCVAYSLLTCNGFNPEHQLQCLSYWYRYAAYSSVMNRVVDIGASVKAALDEFLATGKPYTRNVERLSAGNASLTRSLPIALFYFDDFAQCMHYAEQSSLLTHTARETVDACRYITALLYGALKGETKSTLLAPYYSPVPGYWERSPLCPAIDGIARGDYQGKSRDRINSGAYVVHTLEAALWAFHRTSDFRSGALDAVNLAGDADAVGSVFGQIAGAFYGEMTIPTRWISWLTEAQGFYHFAQELLAASSLQGRSKVPAP